MPTKRKASEDSPSSWRTKCIEQFNLEPVPDSWKDAVAIGTESAWKRYYEYRSREEEISSKQPHCYEDDNGDRGEGELMGEWEEQMGWTECIDEWLSWTPKLGDIVLDGNNDIRTGEYFGHIWSPYTIPHALGLNHYYHHRAGWSSISFYTTWSYRMIDFEDARSIESEYKLLCSNCYENEELRADVIDTANLNIDTVNKIRSFLFGSDSEESKKLICTDERFLRIMFGAMGTVDPDLENDMRNGYLGYKWEVFSDGNLRRELFDAKVPEEDDSEGDPPESFESYYPDGCSWLRHRILEITGTLGPVSRHYKHPTIKDAPGYYEYSLREAELDKDEEDEKDEPEEVRNFFRSLRENHSREEVKEQKKIFRALRSHIMEMAKPSDG